MNDVPGRILVVDDDPNILQALSVTFETLGFECATYENGAEALAQFAKEKPSIALVDLAMPGMNGLQVLHALRERDPLLPVIIMTAFGGLDSAVDAVHEGAYEYLVKPLDFQRLKVLIPRAMEVRALSLAVKHSSSERRTAPMDSILVGRHPSMVEVFKGIGLASQEQNRSTVLIIGETGTGKGLVARAIHEASAFHSDPLVVVTCAGVPETLIESDLFGHERGSFTGAVDRHIGKVEVAGSGTVFLDEVGDLSLTVQQKFLRLLETGEYERLGSNKTRHVRARFIAATHRDLAAAAKEGAYREDLYYRLNVIKIVVPPLRERREDITLMVDHFLRLTAGGASAETVAVSPEAMELLLAHDYPGNVRELRHTLEQASALSRGPVILPEHLPGLRRASSAAPALPMVSENLREARHYVLETFEKQFVERMLRKTDGNVTEAAVQAGVQRQSFQRLMQKHGISSESYRPRR